MATAQTTVQQYEPLRPPSTWSAEERKLIQQLTDRFDDLYSRMGRLRFEDLGTKMQERLTDTETTLEVQGGQIAAKVSQEDYEASLLVTTEGLNALVAKTTQMDGTLTNDVETKANAQTRYTQITADATSVTTLIGTIQGSISDMQTSVGALNDFKDEQATYIRQDSAGVHVGKNSYQAETLVASDGLHIKDNKGAECAYFTDSKSFIKNAQITDTLQVGGFQYIRFGTGRMSIKWVG